MPPSRVDTPPLVHVIPDPTRRVRADLRIAACEQLRPLGRGKDLQCSPMTFRQCLRQYAGRVPREIVLESGESLVVGLDWVAADFVHARVAGRPTLVPLTQIAAVLGAV